ncbi:MAG: anhydro-N-acetylmuramic acid kinase [Rhodospirillaceae bacterium]
MEGEKVLAVGLMSGTSLDGVDAAIIETDGAAVTWRGPALTEPYDDAFRESMRNLLGHDPLIRPPPRYVIERFNAYHADAVRRVLADAGKAPSDVRAIGYHGQTVMHRPDLGVTRQIGDAAMLADATGIDVVCDMRLNDMAQGGEGAPLAPAYHWALAAGLEKPVAVLNLGGVGNVTWIGPDNDRDGGGNDGGTEGALLAFDTGPGNALLNDWTAAKIGEPYDRDGKLAAEGVVDDRILKVLLSYPYFNLAPPKSLDRNDFKTAPLVGMAPAAGAATLAAFTVHSVAMGARFFPASAKRWLVTGGGRKNPVIMAGLQKILGAPVDPVEAVGWDGDALEAQAFAFLAVRSILGLPLSYPGTTGVRRPATGGRLLRAGT